MSNGGGVNKGGRKRGRKSGSHARSGRIKGEMVAECCPLLCSSDKDRLAPQVSSLRRSQAQGQGRCMNKPAYKHLIITQAEEALWIKMSLFICFPFPHFGSLADFFLRSHFLTHSLLSALPHPLNQPAPPLTSHTYYGPLPLHSPLSSSQGCLGARRPFHLPAVNLQLSLSFFACLSVCCCSPHFSESELSQHTHTQSQLWSLAK